MENSTKALVIVASFVIGVMILMILLYMFDLSASVPVQYERTKQDEMVLAFNAKLEKYNLMSDFNNDGKVDKDTVIDDYGTVELDSPSNSFSDLISACNLVNDINTKNEQDNIESVLLEFNIKGKTYSITPDKVIRAGQDLPKNYVFEGSIDDTNTDMVDLFELMTTKVDTAMIDGVSTDTFLDDVKYWEGHKVRYRYYFDAEVEYGLNPNEVRNFGKIIRIVFTMKETKDFDALP